MRARSPNLDENQWPHAERFDIGRLSGGHLALGVGVHNCVGQDVARAEGEAVLTALAAKVDRITPTGKPEWRPNTAILLSSGCRRRFTRVGSGCATLWSWTMASRPFANAVRAPK